MTKEEAITKITTLVDEFITNDFKFKNYMLRDKDFLKDFIKWSVEGTVLNEESKKIISLKKGLLQEVKIYSSLVSAERIDIIVEETNFKHYSKLE